MRKYFVYFSLFFLSAALFAGIGVMQSGIVRGMHCDQSNKPAGAYAFYCNDPAFTDYEQGAIYYGFEPHMIENVKKADVVFLGNSRMMYAMMPNFGEKYLKKRGIRPFEFAFGDMQLSEYVLALIKKYEIHPKVVIINVDPFFSHYVYRSAQAVVAGWPPKYPEYAAKHAALALGPDLCARMPFFCQHRVPVLYRDYESGHWIIPTPDRHVPYVISTKPVDMEAVKNTQAVAEDFLSHLQTPRECVILTGLPHNNNNPAFAEMLAKRLHTRSISVYPKSPATYDETHFDGATALAWQKEFFPKALPIIQKCLKESKPAQP